MSDQKLIDHLGQMQVDDKYFQVAVLSILSSVDDRTNKMDKRVDDLMLSFKNHEITDIGRFSDIDKHIGSKIDYTWYFVTTVSVVVTLLGSVWYVLGQVQDVQKSVNGVSESVRNIEGKLDPYNFSKVQAIKLP